MVSTEVRPVPTPGLDRYPTAQPARPARNVGSLERWLSLIGGGAIAFYGLKRRSLGGAALAGLGGGLAYRGATARCPVYEALGISTSEEAARGIQVTRSITIRRPPEELYRFWRRFESLPRFMTHLLSVTPLSGGRSRWVARAPAGRSVAWDAEVTAERENEWIAWRSLPGAAVENAGWVRFTPAPGGRGTVVTVSLEYRPPAGALGATVARLFGEAPEQQIEADLQHLKQGMEAG